MTIELRNWQKDAFKRFSDNAYKGILKVGTGKGKTVFAIYCIQELMKENKIAKTAIIVPTINLMHQWRKELIKFLDIDEKSISLYYGQKKETKGSIVIYVVNSAVKNDSMYKTHVRKHFSFIIADECHHYGANTFSNIFKTKTKYALGLSATPERERDISGTKEIVKGIGDIVFELNHLDDPSEIPEFSIWNIRVQLGAEEFDEYVNYRRQLMRYYNILLNKYQLIDTDPDFDEKIKEYASKNDATAKKILSIWSNMSRIKNMTQIKIPVISELVSMELGSKIIVFCERIAFCELLYQELRNKIKEPLFMIHSRIKKHVVIETLEKYRDCENGILIAPRMIDEGYDVPDASVSIISGFTSSARQRIQRDGRILRKTDDKKHVTSYSIILNDIDEMKYFKVLTNAQIEQKALDGQWLQFDYSSLTFEDDTNFRQEFVDFLKRGEISNAHFKNWLSNELDKMEEFGMDRIRIKNRKSL